MLRLTNLKFSKERIGYYFITDSVITTVPVVKQVESIVESGLGVKYIQYREKHKPKKQMLAEVNEVKSLLPKQTKLIINDYVDLALEHADGVHIGEDDMPLEKVIDIAERNFGTQKKFVIGVSASTIDSVLNLNNYQIAYVGFGPIFATTTKRDAHAPVGLHALEQALKLSKHPIVAIGGINTSNLDSVLALKPSGIAAISLVLGKRSINFSPIKKIQRSLLNT